MGLGEPFIWKPSAWQTRSVFSPVEQESAVRRRVLVVAKTYPELSSKYGETVCTAGVDEAGNPLRLYPIPFRYLSGPQRFKRYQWITASLRKSQHDPRPESYTVQRESITLEEEIPVTSDEWGLRADSVLRLQAWQYSSMRTLWDAQRDSGRSLAFMRPQSIVGVSVHKRDAQDARSFEQKLKDLKDRNTADRQQLDLFESTVPPQMKNLQYVGERVCVDWKCADDGCTGHSMQVLDWEVCELARKEGLDAAKAKVAAILDSERYKSALILGNFHLFPQSFTIIGLWYPLRNDRLF